MVAVRIATAIAGEETGNFATEAVFTARIAATAEATSVAMGMATVASVDYSQLWAIAVITAAVVESYFFNFLI